MLNPCFDFMILFKKLPTVNAHDKEINLSHYKKLKKKKTLNASIIHLSNKTRYMELIALNLTCTEKESFGILSE